MHSFEIRAELALFQHNSRKRSQVCEVRGLRRRQESLIAKNTFSPRVFERYVWPEVMLNPYITLVFKDGSSFLIVPDGSFIQLPFWERQDVSTILEVNS